MSKTRFFLKRKIAMKHAIPVIFTSLLHAAVATATPDVPVNEVRDSIIHVLEAKPLPKGCDVNATSWFMMEVAYVEAGYISHDGEMWFSEGKGPDYGPFQINIETAKSVLGFNNGLEIMEITGYDFHGNADGLVEELKTNSNLGAYIFREKYGHQSFRDPDGERSSVWTGDADLLERATFWKETYNTFLGKGTINHYLERSVVVHEYFKTRKEN